MRLAICDDEEDIRILFPTLDSALYSSGNELLAGPPPDILLLDIQVPGQSGMEIARELRRRNREWAASIPGCAGGTPSTQRCSTASQIKCRTEPVAP